MITPEVAEKVKAHAYKHNQDQALAVAQNRAQAQNKNLSAAEMAACIAAVKPPLVGCSDGYYVWFVIPADAKIVDPLEPYSDINEDGSLAVDLRHWNEVSAALAAAGHTVTLTDGILPA